MTIENNPPLGIYPMNINVLEPAPEPAPEPYPNPPLGIYPMNINVPEPAPEPYPNPIIPDINPENNIDNNPYQLTLTTCCPPKVHHGNGIRRSWTAGTFLIDGSHLNKARLCTSRINNTIFGPIHGKPVFVKNNLNIYGRYAGFPGGSGAPIRNKF
jgi:hypothetical protein